MALNQSRIIKVVDYDPLWASEFIALKQVIQATLRDLALAVEHVGSTSVPGLSAKPIIDLNVVIKSNVLLPEVIHRLAMLGYLYQGDLGIAEREAFDRQGQDVPRDGTGRNWYTHYLYVCPQNSQELVRQLAFRDYLRQHPEVASTYGNLKRQLAQQFPHDIDSYIVGKRDFIAEITRRAMNT